MHSDVRTDIGVPKASEPPPGEVPGGNPSERRWVRRLARYCWRHKQAVTISVGGTLLATAGSLVIPLLQRSAIDNVIVAHHASVWPLAIGLLIAAAANFAGGTARGKTRSTPASWSAARSPT